MYARHLVRKSGLSAVDVIRRAAELLTGSRPVAGERYGCHGNWQTKAKSLWSRTLPSWRTSRCPPGHRPLTTRSPSRSRPAAGRRFERERERADRLMTECARVGCNRSWTHKPVALGAYLARRVSAEPLDDPRRDQGAIRRGNDAVGGGVEVAGIRRGIPPLGPVLPSSELRKSPMIQQKQPVRVFFCG
jgi:hypothetical protein